MSEKQPIKINLSNFLLLIAIVVIAIMGVCIFVLNKNINFLSETVKKNDEKTISYNTVIADNSKTKNLENNRDAVIIESVRGEQISKFIENVWLNQEEYKENMPEFQNVKNSPKDYLAACAALGVLHENNNYQVASAKLSDFNNALVKLFGKDVDGILNESDIEKAFLIEKKNSDNTYSVSKAYDGGYFSSSEYILGNIESNNNSFYVDLYEYKYEFIGDELDPGEPIKTGDPICFYDKQGNVIINAEFKVDNNNEIITLINIENNDEINWPIDKDHLLSNYKDKLSHRKIELKYNSEDDSFIMLNNKLEK